VVSGRILGAAAFGSLLAGGGLGCARNGDVAPAPAPRGCITDVAPGAHTFTCQGLRTDLFVPAACARAGCGVILELHGDTGTGLLIDANTDLMARAADSHFIVVAPTGPPRADGLGATWTLDEDDKLLAIVDAVTGAFLADPKARHITGFSRGGYVTWRLMCGHADRFASVAPAAAGSNVGGDCDGVVEVSCPFDAAIAGGMPARAIPVLMLIGRTDTAVPVACAQRILDQAVNAWQLGAASAVDGDAHYQHQMYAPPPGAGAGAGGLIETYRHDYQTVADGPQAAFKGHCMPGSTFDPYAAQYAIACAPPNAFTWGAEVLRFFEAHPGR
jgi:poly(3-hydroxybutyrate) depolymerase